jgi:hypothetical protein
MFVFNNLEILNVCCMLGCVDCYKSKDWYCGCSGFWKKAFAPLAIQGLVGFWYRNRGTWSVVDVDSANGRIGGFCQAIMKIDRCDVPPRPGETWLLMFVCMNPVSG